jgi:hypothetical protein
LQETFPAEFWNWYDCAGEGDGEGAGFGGPPAYAVAGNPIIATADTIDTAWIAVIFMGLLAFCWDTCPLVGTA